MCAVANACLLLGLYLKSVVLYLTKGCLVVILLFSVINIGKLVFEILRYKPRASRQFSDWFHSFTLTYNNYMPFVSSSFYFLIFFTLLLSFFTLKHMCILSLPLCTGKYWIIPSFELILMSSCSFLLIKQIPELPRR